MGKRFPEGDRPSIEGFTRGNLPQMIAFKTPEGSIVEYNLERAIQLGLVGQGEVAIKTIDIEEAIKREHKKWKV
jgi:hypothetical protein